MKASYSWLQSYFAEPLPDPEALAALLTEHVFEVEGIEDVQGDRVFDFKVLPDRAHYLLSHRGLAREIGVLLKRETVEGEPAQVADASGKSVTIRIDNDLFCRRMVTRRFDGVSGETPAWIRERLEAVGQKCIAPLVDISNYVMLDMGQPSHMLDADKVQGDLVVRNARQGETIEILGGRVVELKETDAVIADDAGPLEIAGVKGGERAAITADTRNVIMHCGNYDSAMIRVTATRLDLRSDASKRFENEITPAYAPEGFARLAALVASIAPDAQAGPVADRYPRPQEERRVTVTARLVSEVLGAEVSEDEIADLLARMGCTVTRDGGVISFVPPADRFDLAIPEDVADEVGRVRGYNSLPGKLPAPLQDPQPQDPLFWYGEKAKNALVAAGYAEALLYALRPTGAHEILYPLAEDKAWLRATLLDQFKEKLASNRLNADLLGLDEVRMFEIGQAFPGAGEHASLVMGVAIARKRGVTAAALLEEGLAALAASLGAEARGEIRTDGPLAFVEIDFSALVAQLPPPGALVELGFAQLPTGKTYRKIVPYPFVTRDVAVLVPDDVAASAVHDVVDGAAGDLRVSTRLFDDFAKDGKRSYAFRLVFQSPERTLADAEVNAAMQDVETAVRAQGWEVR